MIVNSVPRGLRWLGKPLVTVIMQLIAGLSLVLAVLVGFQQYSLASCLRDYSASYSSVTSARIMAADKERQADDIDRIAMDRLVRSFIPGDLVAQRQAQADYLAARITSDRLRNEAIELRRANPLPTNPALTC